MLAHTHSEAQHTVRSLRSLLVLHRLERLSLRLDASSLRSASRLALPTSGLAACAFWLGETGALGNSSPPPAEESDELELASMWARRKPPGCATCEAEPTSGCSSRCAGLVGSERCLAMVGGEWCALSHSATHSEPSRLRRR